MELVKVRVLASGRVISMVSKDNVRYEVNTSDLKMCFYDERVFTHFCYIDRTKLTKVWQNA